EIALEIASILDKRGKNNIRLYLLDCFPEDSYLASLMTPEYLTNIKKAYAEFNLKQGMDPTYINRAISNMDIESRLANGKISPSLRFTKALLFKAMLEENLWKSFNPENFHKHIKN